MTTRAALYLRISRDVSGDGEAVERQRKLCVQLCERRGWQVAEHRVFVDNDVSATRARSKRKQFAAMLTAIEQGKIDVVVVYHVDRLVRRLDELERVISLCERTGVKLATVSGDLDLSTDAGRLNARILASVARGEVERKSRRQKEKIAERAKDGQPRGGGPRRFGYTMDGLHLDPVEAPKLIDLYRRFLEGASMGGLASSLNDQGISTPRGKQWHTNSVRSVLSNPSNAGLRGTRELLDGELGGTGRRERWHTIVSDTAAWPAVISRADWERAMKIIQDPARRVNYIGNRQKHLLSRLAVCGIEGCGQKLISGQRDGIPLLRCPSLRHVSRRADYIELFTVDVILTWLGGPAARDLLRARTPGVDLDGLETKAAGLRQRLKDLAADFGALELSREEYRSAREGARVALAEIDEAVAAASTSDVVARFVGDARDPREVWDAADLETRRALIDAVAVVRVMSGRTGRPGQGPDGVLGTVLIDWRRV